MPFFKTPRISAELPAKKTASSAVPMGRRESASNAESKWNDVWAMILFWGNLLALAGVVSSYASQRALPGFWSLYRPGLVEPIILLSGGLSFAFVKLVQAFPEAVLRGSLFGSCGLLIVSGLQALAFGGANAMGAVILVTGIMGMLGALQASSMVSFTATLLRSVARVIDAQPGLWLVSAGALVLQFLFLASSWLAYAAIEASDQLSTSTASLLETWLVFTLLWTLQVTWNLVHTTVSGSIATYYLGRGSRSVSGPDPVRESLGRAITWSFGSICLGSLLVAVLQLLRSLLARLRAPKREGEREHDSKAVNALLDFLIGVIEDLTKFFNHYAFVYVAVYGRPFTASGWSAWEMLKRSGLMALANANLIGMMTGLAGFCSSILISSAAYILRCWYAGSEHGAPAVSCVVFVFVWLGMANFGQILESAGSTVFVCMAEDPDAILRSDPKLHAEISAIASGSVV
jgi:hypothetical protein